MEVIKEVAKSEGCQHTCVDLHRFCGTHCCVMKWLGCIIVIAGIFGAGFAAGSCHERFERYEHQSRGFYGNNMMMDFSGEYGGRDQYDVSENDKDKGGFNVMYKMMGWPEKVETTATTTPQK